MLRCYACIAALFVSPALRRRASCMITRRHSTLLGGDSQVTGSGGGRRGNHIHCVRNKMSVSFPDTCISVQSVTFESESLYWMIPKPISTAARRCHAILQAFRLSSIPPPSLSLSLSLPAACPLVPPPSPPPSFLLSPPPPPLTF